MNCNITQHNYCIDLFKLIMAVFVVAIHSQLSLSVSVGFGKVLDFIFSLAVPYFFIVSGYLLFRKTDLNNLKFSECKDRISLYLKRVIKMYTIWTAIYFPLTIYGEISYGTPLPKAIIKFLRNFLFVGENFYSWQLWYLLGLIFAILIIYVLLRFKMCYKHILLLSVCVFVLGIALDILKGMDIKSISLYYALFNTTRNGMFYGFFYVSLGMYMSQIKIKVDFKDVIFAFVAIIGAFIFLDMEVLRVFTALLAVIVFRVSLSMEIQHLKFCTVFRNISVKIYLIHMYFIAIYRVFYANNGNVYNYWGCFVFALLCSIILAGFIEYFEERTNSRVLKILF